MIGENSWEQKGVSFGQNEQGTEVWNSTYAVPEPTIVENDQGTSAGEDINGIQIHECSCMSCYGLKSFSCRNMESNLKVEVA